MPVTLKFHPTITRLPRMRRVSPVRWQALTLVRVDDKGRKSGKGHVGDVAIIPATVSEFIW